MYKILPLLFLFLSACSSSDKSLEQILEGVNSEEDAQKLMKKYPDWHIEIMNAKTDGREPNDNLKRLISGEIVITGDSAESYSHKMLELDSVRIYHMRYIFFDGKKLNRANIETRRQAIRQRLENGTKFATLANQFTMDGNEDGGDLGWLERKEMPPGMADSLEVHEPGELFDLDLPDQDWHYLVLKRDDERMKLELKILKMAKK